ncbi:hypothetical protein H6G93_29865 [Nostoc sp. FACHB-973]|nr:hypothetical protein [Nostoc sp. FACHB-973]
MKYKYQIWISLKTISFVRAQHCCAPTAWSLSAIVQIVWSVLVLQNLVCFVYATEIATKNLVGISFVKYRFDNYKDLLIENDSLYIFQNGRKIKVISKFIYHAQDWKAMVETIRENHL